MKKLVKKSGDDPGMMDTYMDTKTVLFDNPIIQIKGRGQSKTFTIRKMSGTVGVERIFPINMPALKKIEVNNKGKVRQSRIYYFRELRGKKARIKEV